MWLTCRSARGFKGWWLLSRNQALENLRAAPSDPTPRLSAAVIRGFKATHCFSALSSSSASTALCSHSPPKGAISDTDENNNGGGKNGSRERSGHGEQSTAKEREEQICTWASPTGVSYVHGAHLAALHCSHLARPWAAISDHSRRCFSSFLCCPLTAFIGIWKYQQTYSTKIISLFPSQLKMPAFTKRKTCSFSLEIFISFF